MGDSDPKLTFLFCILLLPLLLDHFTQLHVFCLSPSPSPVSPPSPASHRRISPANAPSPPSSSSSSSSPISSSLDPKQLMALQSMNIPLPKDPCRRSAADDNATVCDSSTPFRHLLSLRLSSCSDDVQISSTALKSLSTLRSLSILRCPDIPTFHLPPSLASNLRYFSCISSLRRISVPWLTHMQNLTDLTVSGVQVVSSSGPASILSSLRKITSITVSDANLTGFLPKKLHPSITHIDFSRNKLKGKLPASIARLSDLKSLNLSSNQLQGLIPDDIGNLMLLQNLSLSSNSMSGPIPDSMAAMLSLVHLDLSSNRFNGSVPNFLSRMKHLRYLNLENNDFHGAIPFNSSYIKRFAVFRVLGNSNLCYNRSTVSPTLKLGIAPCDKDGFPLSPPPDRSSSSADSSTGSDSGDSNDDDDDSEDEKPKGSHRHGPNKVVLGLAIGLSTIVFLIIFLILLAKWCG